MKAKRLDCRGLACPHPVLKTKELLDQGEAPHLTVLVDNPAAQENVGRFLALEPAMLLLDEPFAWGIRSWS